MERGGGRRASRPTLGGLWGIRASVGIELCVPWAPVGQSSATVQRVAAGETPTPTRRCPLGGSTER
eukprot:1177744-Pyramimonas_sp.AAC.1